MFKERVNALFSAIKAVFAELKTVVTNDGMNLYYEGDEFGVGVAVYTDNGVAPDGDYMIGEDKVKVADGVVVEIEREAPKEEVIVDETESCTPKEKMAEEVVVEPTVEEAPDEAPKVEYITKEAFEEAINGINVANDTMNEAIKGIADRITAIESRISDIEGKPKGGEPHDEFSKVVKSEFKDVIEGLEAVKAMKASMRVK